jgi:hypothetical protein
MANADCVTPAGALQRKRSTVDRCTLAAMTHPDGSSTGGGPGADALARGLAAKDPMAIARAGDLEELKRLIAAEELLEKQHQRRMRSARIASLSAALVGYVALAGFFANAYQNYNSKKQAEERAHTDEERWAKEFKRAQDADKYRAFFETSALATDRQNPDKRLVGYALLKEFVNDKDYNSKATFMLEESLALELRDDRGPGLDEMHRAAVISIVSALSQTPDCHALARAARSIEKLATRHAQGGDLAESSEVVGLYVLRLVGRATERCSAKDVLEVRKPIRDLLLKQPAVVTLPPKSGSAEVDRRIGEILATRCAEELQAGMTECAGVPAAWAKLCLTPSKDRAADVSALCAASAAPALSPAAAQ